MAEQKKVPIVHWKGYQMYPVMHHYAETENVRIDLHLTNIKKGDSDSDSDDDEVYAHATSDLPWVKLNDDEVMIKDWSENKGIVAPLQEAKVIGEKLREDNMSGFSIYTLLLKAADYLQ